MPPFKAILPKQVFPCLHVQWQYLWRQNNPFRWQIAELFTWKLHISVHFNSSRGGTNLVLTLSTLFYTPLVRICTVIHNLSDKQTLKCGLMSKNQYSSFLIQKISFNWIPVWPKKPYKHSQTLQISQTSLLRYLYSSLTPLHWLKKKMISVVIIYTKIS